MYSLFFHSSLKRDQPIEELRNLMRSWYNGYRFGRPTNTLKVYNPVSLHYFLSRGEFSNYWFGTATPTFAIDLIRQYNFPLADLELGVTAGAELDERHEVNAFDLVPLLFQTGYLTIADFDEATQKYKLKYPNTEVRHSFLNHLLHAYTGLDHPQLDVQLQDLRQQLIDTDFNKFFASFNVLLAKIPHSLHIPQESYYHSLIYVLLRMLGLKPEAELSTHRSRLDLLIFVDERCFLFEFKINQPAKKALAQILEKEYYVPYQQEGKEIWCIGVSFDTKKRKVVDWVKETMTETVAQLKQQRKGTTWGKGMSSAKAKKQGRR